MTKVLLTGFGPYGHTPVNPAQSVAQMVDGETIAGAEIIGRIVPGTFFKSIEATAALVDQLEPELVIMLGEYGGRSMITVERIAQNFNDATRYGLADNDGVALLNDPTAPDGPAAYFATAPIRAMVKAMRAAGIPADISDAAGTLVCNHLMYGVLHHIATRQLSIRAGWIHLPALPCIAALEANLNMPSMSAETSAAGVRVAIQAALEHPRDIQEPIASRFQI